MQQDRTQTMSMAPHPSDNVHPVSHTALAEEARAMWAEARRLTAQAQHNDDAHLLQHADICRAHGNELFRQALRLEQQAIESLPAEVTAAIGPRWRGLVYTDGAHTYEVRQVVIDASEARRIMKRRAATFAIEVVDIVTGDSDFTCSVWTGSDRVLKAVA